MAAGLKRKQATEDVKSSNGVKAKKVKVRDAKPAGKKEIVVPAKKGSKRTPVSESEELVESDTSEDENGFYGFAAKEESEQDNSDSDESESEVDVGDEGRGVKKAKVEKKDKANGTKPSTVEALNGMFVCFYGITYRLIPYSFIVKGSTCQAEGALERTKSCEAQCRYHSTVKATVGAVTTQVSRSQG